MPEKSAHEKNLFTDAIAVELTGFLWGKVFIGCEYLMMFIHLKQNFSFFVGMPPRDDSKGYVVD
ncbi:MAG TPA: hypothetical protein PL064_13450 [Thermogutta sp.]|nr:hypothetical protein [Thermogutta sp.]HPU07553.1 hypothetical protein [Thermogutta sp.]HPZ84438.1 hypothetical protein [Thermogutta sp.]